MSVVLNRGEKGRHTARPGGTLFALVSHTVRMQLRGVIIWGAALGLYSAGMVASFTAIEGSADQLNQLMEAYPKGMLEAFGVTDLGDPANYLHSQVFGLAPLALSFFPILALANAIAGAEERGTIDVLLGNPLPRWQLVAGNFIAVSISLLEICAVVGLLTWGTAVLTGVELSPREVADAVLNLWPTCIMFGAVALLCSALFHRRGLAIAVPAFLLFGMFLIDTIGRASNDLEDWRPVSVFYYYGSAIENGIDWTHFGSITLIALALVLLAALVFNQRDIYT
ncbi:MAG: ABC transporter permease subunit [Rubrobacteraceae bacterium]|nr:ABC transporter permease subunit [Rubrobacteraceae bacterium]